MGAYEAVCSLANRLGYQEFTKLQQKVFEHGDAYDFDKWLMAIGATSSGKTLVAVLLYFYHFQIYREKGKPCRMLFAVPYRALAAQKTAEITEMVQKMGLDLKIVQSTGEFRSNDMDVLNGEADIAVVIYEKIFMFSCMNSSFLRKYDLLAMDEIGLTQNMARGIKADFILARARNVPSLRVIALATPFYDWTNYIDTYRFTKVQEDERPVKLETYPVYYGKSGVNYVLPGCQAVDRFLFPTKVNKSYEVNPWRRIDHIIKKICVYHLKLGHKILIIENSRYEVRMLARRLCKSIQEDEKEDEKLLRADMTQQECKKYIRTHTGIQDEEELYSIMDREDYQAFAAGIGYHNADIPSSLRALVEHEFLLRGGKLQIVCSTETLVYGINSNVDVVIIPSMLKQRAEENMNISFLFPNEYMNYAGRAGRLDVNAPRQGEEKAGYVYPLVKASYEKPDELRGKMDQKLLWEELQREIAVPQRIGSRYFSLKAGERPFYMLSLLSNERENTADTAVTQTELEEIMERIPRDAARDYNGGRDVRYTISELLERRLIYVANDNDDEDDGFVPEYELTDAGRSLAGYIVDLESFDAFMRAANRCITAEKMYKVDLLNAIIHDKQIIQDAAERIGILKDHFPQLMDKVVKQIKTLLDQWKSQMSKELYGSIKRSVKRFDSSIRKQEYKRLENDRNFINNRLLFALLMWSDESCSAKQLFDAFAINYVQMARFSEGVSYRLDIIRLALPVARMEGEGALYQRLGAERLHEAQQWLKDLSDELFYRVPIHICRFLDIQCCDPASALKLREVGRIYKELDAFSQEDMGRRQKRRLDFLAGKIKKWDPSWQKAFKEKFEEVLKYAD